MGRLHDALKASGYEGHDLERFLVRLLFCLFADDTGIFEPRDIFHDLIAERTPGRWHRCRSMAEPTVRGAGCAAVKRQRSLDEDLDRFPYVNGDLFR